ncbi:8-oxo-dGTP diphosphatase MutT [Parahaliea sp. F7430]|uniref:8-oxo-dGTP diphosphatase n=1 Tax=Sediminihaliea albiluteola TaxID=2758564 RepID=A0A7W2TVX0_9GAMM|nr:8-oxo-dGTP diphosphatase MutT [Sediminihaliea albiluteola]MBA6412950.1 8-oxo-dGTP diphosphatase MutT [Sediminihaliea albiluteola]
MALQVAVGVVLNSRREILLTRRAVEVHQGGLWEFPGGKLEPGETVLEALGRELREELGIEVTKSTPLLEVRHDYAEGSVLLDVHIVWAFEGSPQALEGQPMAWVRQEALDDYAFPAANMPIIAALREQLADSELSRSDQGA